MAIYFSDKAFCFTRQAVVGFLLLVCFTEITFAETPAKSPGNAAADIKIIENSGAELRLNVRQMLLREVLESIAHQTRIPIHYSVLPEGLVNANCTGATLKQILECLVAGKADLIVRYQPKNNGLSRKGEVSEAWIMGSNQKDFAPDEPGSKIMTKDGSDSASHMLKGEVDAEQADELLKMAKSKDASERVEAIAGLLSAGRKGDPDVKAALEQALNDDDALVRAQAISSLVSREGHAASAAIEQALHDKSVDVRMMAVDVITDDVELLQQALYDSDQNVRDFAALKLEESGLKNGGQP